MFCICVNVLLVFVLRTTCRLVPLEIRAGGVGPRSPAAGVGAAVNHPIGLEMEPES